MNTASRWSLLLAACVTLILAPGSGLSRAASVASYPTGWQNWPIVKESMVPAADVVLPPDTPLFIQETVKAYNWINDGKGTKLTIYVHPDKLEQFKQHGPYSDGPTAVGVYETPDVVFVTEHLAGEPLYGTYDSHGRDISDTHEEFTPQFCTRCHDAYKDICINGTCATPVIDLFEDKTGPAKHGKTGNKGTAIPQ